MPASLLRRALVVLLALMLPGCGAVLPAPTATSAPSDATSLPPTATPLPLAAKVNGHPILLADFQAELLRYEEAQRQRGIELATQDTHQREVLESLLDLELLAQEAAAEGASISEDRLARRIDELAQDRGGSEGMAAWMASNHYDLESLRRALRRELLAQQAVEALAEGLPAEVEHVHLRHILVDSRQRADELRSLLDAGAEFGQLAVEHSLDPSTRVNGGDLGWVPRGVLSQPAIEEAAFALPVGQVSDSIETELGYHLVEVLGREARQPSPNDLRTLRRRTVEDWLASAREAAQIEILIEP